MSYYNKTPEKIMLEFGYCRQPQGQGTAQQVSGEKGSTQPQGTAQAVGGGEVFSEGRKLEQHPVPVQPVSWEDGLSEDQIRSSRNKYGSNKLQEKKKKSKLQIFAEQFKDLLVIRCAKCGRRCARKIKWYQSGSSTSVAVGRCIYHGYMLSKIKLKAAGGSDDNVFALKKTEKVDKKTVEEVKARQVELREKRKQKRHEQSQRKKKNRDEE